MSSNKLTIFIDCRGGVAEVRNYPGQGTDLDPVEITIIDHDDCDEAIQLGKTKVGRQHWTENEPCADCRKQAQEE